MSVMLAANDGHYLDLLIHQNLQNSEIQLHLHVLGGVLLDSSSAM